MTKVTVIKPEQKNMTPLSEGKHGKWYKIVKYEPNPRHVGQIGIFLSKSKTGSGYNYLVTPDGTCYSHSYIFIEELSEVTVTVKE
jgi:hypothetical protein